LIHKQILKKYQDNSSSTTSQWRHNKNFVTIMTKEKKYKKRRRILNELIYNESK